jgi:hypothetical protein
MRYIKVSKGLLIFNEVGIAYILITFYFYIPVHFTYSIVHI